MITEGPWGVDFTALSVPFTYTAATLIVIGQICTCIPKAPEWFAAYDITLQPGVPVQLIKIWKCDCAQVG